MMLQDTRSLGAGRIVVTALLVAAGYYAGCPLVAAADGGALFKEKCAACHSVGGGPLAGPDLKGVIAKLGKERTVMAIVDPSKTGLAPTMPNLGLTRAQGEAIGAFLDGTQALSGAAAQSNPEPTKATEREATPEEMRLGQRLFEGSVRFANGGPACNACHHVHHEAVLGGAVLASDLTHAMTRLDVQGFGGLVANAPFPVMQVAYEGKAVKPEEIRALTVFLQHAKTQSAEAQPPAHAAKLLSGAAAGVVVLLAFFWMVGARRKKRCVNQDIYDRQIESE